MIGPWAWYLAVVGRDSTTGFVAKPQSPDDGLTVTMYGLTREQAEPLLEVLNLLEQQVSELSEALDIAIADTDDAERRLERERERNAKLEKQRLEMVHDLDRALHGESVARAQTPETVWFDLLNEAGRLKRVAKAADAYDEARCAAWDELTDALAALEGTP